MRCFADYIGLPWAAGAEGPESYDCHAFTRHIQASHFGLDIPRIVFPDYDDIKALVGIYQDVVAKVPWRKVSAPQHGDVVLVRTPLHTGTWLDIDGGGVLHCVRHQGVVFTKDSSWGMSRFGRRQYLRHESKP